MRRPCRGAVEVSMIQAVDYSNQRCWCSIISPQPTYTPSLQVSEAEVCDDGYGVRLPWRRRLGVLRHHHLALRHRHDHLLIRRPSKRAVEEAVRPQPAGPPRGERWPLRLLHRWRRRLRHLSVLIWSLLEDPMYVRCSSCNKERANLF